MLRKVFIAVLAAILFCSCSENETEEISVSITAEPEYINVTEDSTKAEYIVTDTEYSEDFGFGHTTAEMTEPPVEETAYEISETEYVWSGFSAETYQENDNAYVGIDFKFHPEITAEDISEINQVREGYDSVTCSIENTAMGSLAFLAECKGITVLTLSDLPSDTSELAAALEQMDSLKQIYIQTSEYSDKAINDIFKAAPDCRIEYNWYEESVRYSGNDKYFLIGTETPNAYGGYDDDGVHGVWFCNSISADVTVESVEVYYYYNDEWIPVEFSDGTFSKTIDFTVEPMYNIYRNDPYKLYDNPYDFQLDSENFSFENARTGRYKLSFKTDMGVVESDFYINSSSEYDFLTEEQKQIFIDATNVINKYFSTSTYYPDEFPEGGDGYAIIREKFSHCLTYDFACKISLGIYIDENGNVISGGGDRGSNIMFDGAYIQPVYVGDDMIVIKRFVVNSHSDFPNDFSISAYNVTMVPTEDGWRVSSMYEYY